jgi:hypothetical protein
MRVVLLLLLSCPAHALQYGSCGSAGEVYGATGRIGSLLLRSGAGKLAAVPRGLAPGCLSPPGTPILVTAPTDALANVLRATPPQRQHDLVLLCNGAVRELAADVLGEAAAAQITAGCLFFGVLAPGASPTHGADAPRTALAAAGFTQCAHCLHGWAYHRLPVAGLGVLCCPSRHGLLEEVAWAPS